MILFHRLFADRPPKRRPPDRPVPGRAVEPLESRRLLSAESPAPDAEPTEPAPAIYADVGTDWNAIATGEDGLGLASLAQGVTGPLVLDAIRPDGDGWLADGQVLLPGGEAIAFTTDASITRVDPDAGVPIIELRLGEVDLDLLGLRVNLQPLALQVSAVRGEGQVLGNVLIELLGSDQAAAMDAIVGPVNEALAAAFDGGDRLMASLPTADAIAEAEADLNYAELASAGSLLGKSAVEPGTFADDAGALRTSGEIELPDEVRVLSLSIEELDLYVLGLRVQTLEPVDLSVRATAGPGALLGNLFVGLGSLLDPLLPDQEPGPSTPAKPAEPPTSSLDDLAGATPVIALELREVDLYLLGLEANLNVDLLVGLETDRGDLLGRLLLAELTQITEEIKAANFSPLEDLLGFLFNGSGSGPGNVGEAGPVAQALRSETGPPEMSSQPSSDPDPLSLLDLSIDSLDLDLLGVLVRSQGISLELRADPGPGALLGNLLGRLFGAFESPPSPSPVSVQAPAAQEPPASPPTSDASNDRTAMETVAPPAGIRTPGLGGVALPVVPSLFGDDDPDDLLAA
jgi:hypothetical protein